MKTPDEIKKGLECCHSTDMCECDKCPYSVDGEETMNCDFIMSEDAIAYIQQLEKKCNQLEREREALLDALKKADVYGECENCKHRDSAPSDCDFECGSCQRNCRCWECRDGDNWEWVGVKEDDK